MEEEEIKIEGYYEEKSGCFQPFKSETLSVFFRVSETEISVLIDEWKMIEPFGKDGWNEYYWKKLLIK